LRSQGGQAEGSLLPGFRPEAHIRIDLSDVQAGDQILARSRISARFGSDPPIASEAPIEVDEGRYVLSGLVVLRFVSPDGGTAYEVLTLVAPSSQGAFSISTGGAMFPPRGIGITPSWRDKLDRFEARPA
jgi:hypothetical protein